MTKTQNYNLNQWDPHDEIRVEDFNADNQKIDAALAIAGNCKISCGTYTGTGTHGADDPCSLTFDFAPKVVFVHQAPGYFGFSYWASNAPYFSAYNQIFYSGANTFYAAGSEGTATINYTLENNSLTWYTTKSANLQMNTSGANYAYVAIG